MVVHQKWIILNPKALKPAKGLKRRARAIEKLEGAPTFFLKVLCRLWLWYRVPYSKY